MSILATFRPALKLLTTHAPFLSFPCVFDIATYPNIDYEILEPAPTEPIPPLPPYNEMGSGQRCIQQGTLTPPNVALTPNTPEVCIYNSRPELSVGLTISTMTCFTYL